MNEWLTELAYRGGIGVLVGGLAWLAYAAWHRVKGLNFSLGGNASKRDVHTLVDITMRLRKGNNLKAAAIGDKMVRAILNPEAEEA